jgi:hypothetical protein
LTIKHESRRLANVGFVNVYNIIDGMEGEDPVDDPESVNHGKRMKDGWKNSGSSRTYDVNPELIGLPVARRILRRVHIGYLSVVPRNYPLTALRALDVAF